MSSERKKARGEAPHRAGAVAPAAGDNVSPLRAARRARQADEIAGKVITRAREPG